MGFLAIEAGLFGAQPAMLTEAVRLMVAALIALVPVGGIVSVGLFLLFKYAEERA